MRIVEQVLDMGGGYVLDFNNRTFDEFFTDLGADIEPVESGLSKANRLRAFLRAASTSDCARVLHALLEYRGDMEGDERRASIGKYREILSRLEGIAVPLSVSQATPSILTVAYVRELSDKAESRLAVADLEGAITLSRTLVEAVLEQLELRLTGQIGNYSGDLQKQYKAVAKILRIDDSDPRVDEGFKQIARGLVQIVNGLAAIRNMASDGHARHVRPEGRHARVSVNSARTVASFLVEVYEAKNAASSPSDETGRS
ncbi:abortive infection family protein [Brachybacterium sp. MASK1Z-5]|uniref:Abortive infection family protein n=1 Tax=Brachybacterium halotolerans TaxID=2795215 RepID=A0ABS1BBP8_9MICO|nr:abortive infection family protein [Brachybacterium halotolerans]MBK0332068.1 abortive infection family protein [Brachybacterium halotolerans]